MLKQFIKSLLESFLSSKRQWVGRQSLPSGSTQEIVVTGKSGTATATCDGWCRIQGNTTWIRFSGDGVFVSIRSPNRDWPTTSLPVKKGSKLAYEFGADSTDAEQRLWFVPNVASE